MGEKLLTEKPGREGRYAHLGITDLRHLAPEGCKLCEILRKALERAEFREIVELVESAALENNLPEDYCDVYIGGAKQDAAYQLDFFYRVGTATRQQTELITINLVPLRVRTREPGDGGNLLSPLSHGASVIPSNTSSDASFDIISAWLTKCTETHSSCCRTLASSRRLPTRLVEISENRLTLRNSRSLPLTTAYVTLSHCWGGLEITKLTKASHLAFSDGSIPLRELPLTFQHAILVTKRLGIHHIWVDSLCIIQDSYEDWVQESSRMWEVYTNSHCNIAATASSDGRGGLFRSRAPSSTSPCRVKTTWDGLNNGHYHCSELREWEQEIVEAPLNRRGWVLQERLLAPRVLSFGAHQLYWECKEFSASETCPEGLPKAMRGAHMKQNWDLLHARLAEDGSVGLYIAWRYCVGEYSKCKLTNASDKLVALSGIAKIIHERLGGQDTYLAGLWKSRLKWHLLWETQSNTDPFPRTAPCRAPTWSWASLEGEITFSDPANDDVEEPWMITILDASVVPAGDPESASPFGPVVGGRIRLCGPLFRVGLEPKWMKRGSYIGSDMILYGLRPSRFSSNVHYDEGIGRDTNLDRDIHCLIFRRYIYEGDRWVIGLLLEPTGQGKELVAPSRDELDRKLKGEFKRFGNFATCGNEFYDAVMKNRDYIDPQLQFQEDNGGGDYTVTLV
jgi:hypothetical protein